MSGSHVKFFHRLATLLGTVPNYVIEKKSHTELRLLGREFEFDSPGPQGQRSLVRGHKPDQTLLLEKPNVPLALPAGFLLKVKVLDVSRDHRVAAPIQPTSINHFVFLLILLL